MEIDAVIVPLRIQALALVGVRFPEVGPLPVGVQERHADLIRDPVELLADDRRRPPAGLLHRAVDQDAEVVVRDRDAVPEEGKAGANQFLHRSVAAQQFLHGPLPAGSTVKKSDHEVEQGKNIHLPAVNIEYLSPPDRSDVGRAVPRAEEQAVRVGVLGQVLRSDDVQRAFFDFGPAAVKHGEGQAVRLESLAQADNRIMLAQVRIEKLRTDPHSNSLR